MIFQPHTDTHTNSDIILSFFILSWHHSILLHSILPDRRWYHSSWRCHVPPDPVGRWRQTKEYRWCNVNVTQRNYLIPVSPLHRTVVTTIVPWITTLSAPESVEKSVSPILFIGIRRPCCKCCALPCLVLYCLSLSSVVLPTALCCGVFSCLFSLLSSLVIVLSCGRLVLPVVVLWLSRLVVVLWLSGLVVVL